MAKNKKNKKENAGDNLFSKLGRGSQKNGGRTDDEELLTLDPPESDAEEYDSIDISEDADPSDSDLDINELLRKYMPEYSEEETPSGDSGGSGVLSRLKQTISGPEQDSEAESAVDDKLISALDSVFSQSFEEAVEMSADTEEDVEEFTDILADESLEELAEVPEKIEFEKPQEKPGRSRKGGLFGRKNREVQEQPVEEYEFADTETEESSEALPEGEPDRRGNAGIRRRMVERRAGRKAEEKTVCFRVRKKEEEQRNSRRRNFFGGKGIHGGCR